MFAYMCDFKFLKKRMQPYVLVEMFSIVKISFFIHKVDK
jgi:hypothetical protein